MSLSIHRIIIPFVFTAIAPLISVAEEPTVQQHSYISERLAINEDIDPTTVFIQANENLLQQSAVVGDLLKFADSFLGHPYRRGSKGPASFDCSGFTSYIFSNFGIKLGASSRDQYTQGTSLDKDQIEPGDLMFFSGRRNGTKVGHVGIAVSVDDNGVVTFIHAATSGGIRYDKYPDAGYYSNRYIGARRILN